MVIPSAENSIEKMVQTTHSSAQSYVPPAPAVGIVISPPPNLIVKMNNIEINKENTYIAEYLLAGYRRTARGHFVSATQNAAGGSGEAQYENHKHGIDNDYTDDVIYTDTLKSGDIVSVFTCEGSQLYIITDKLVKL